MPIYNYKCDTCGNYFEIKQSINDKPLEDCPNSKCLNENNERGKIHRVISKNIGLVFNGSGFYLTDYAKTNSKTSIAKEISTNKNTGSESKTAVAS